MLIDKTEFMNQLILKLDEMSKSLQNDSTVILRPNGIAKWLKSISAANRISSTDIPMRMEMVKECTIELGKSFNVLVKELHIDPDIMFLTIGPVENGKSWLLISDATNAEFYITTALDYCVYQAKLGLMRRYPATFNERINQMRCDEYYTQSIDELFNPIQDCFDIEDLNILIAQMSRGA